EFSFGDGVPTGERTLNLGPAELHALLALLESGGAAQPALTHVESVAQDDPRSLSAIPVRHEPPDPTVTSDLAARMAAVSQMSVSTTTPADKPPWSSTAQNQRDPTAFSDQRSRSVVVRKGLPRRFVILAGGFGIGLVILVAILVISTWYFHGSLEQELPVAEAPALDPSA